MNKKFYIRVLAMALAALSVLCFFGCKPDEKYYCENSPTAKFIPKIDFMQSWYFSYYTQEELDAHFSALAALGFEKVILQDTSIIENGTIIVLFDYIESVFSAAEKSGVDVILGLSSDERWWSSNFSDAEVERFIENERQVITALAERFTPCAWYFTYEMYQNGSDYAQKWAKILNASLSMIIELKDAPLYLSPFTSTAHIHSIDVLTSFWRDFFEAANLRSCDVFMPQDGYGAVKSEYNADKAAQINERNSAIADCCATYSSARFFVNVEIFASDGMANPERIAMQIRYASSTSCGLGCFSVSHYAVAENNEDFYKTALSIVADFS